MNRTHNYPSQDYSEKQLYPKGDAAAKENVKRDQENDEYQGGRFSDSEVGGQSREQQNPWQGSQERWEQP